MSGVPLPGHGGRAVAFTARRRAADPRGVLLPLPAPGIRLLDVGCGPGTITAGLAEAVRPGRWSGSTRTRPESPGRRGSGPLVGLTFVGAGARDPPFPDGALDAAFACARVEHPPRPAAVCARARVGVGARA